VLESKVLGIELLEIEQSADHVELLVRGSEKIMPMDLTQGGNHGTMVTS
jgi:hypothetical protein